MIALVVRADFFTIVRTLTSAGWGLFWLIPFRAVFFGLYALGWHELLRPGDPGRRAGLGYLFWVTTVREAVDRLLPVASVGGSVIGVRLVRARGLPTATVGATVIVEIVLTLIVSYVFTAGGLLLLLGMRDAGQTYRQLAFAFLLSVPAPFIVFFLLRYGAVFQRLYKFLRPLVGTRLSVDAIGALDDQVRAILRRSRTLSVTGALQLAALMSGSSEIWFVLRLFGHPVTGGQALAMESMALAVRHVAFVVPAGLGVQEAGLIVVGQLVGIDAGLALSVSMAKRMRELLWGVASLASWQWWEARRLRDLSGLHAN